MHDETAFIQTIAERPDDDTPRLVFADWLQDHGQDDRAELIRIQCRLARLEEEDPERYPLLNREHELFKLHVDWRTETGSPVWGQYTRDRGLLSGVHVYDWSAFASKSKEIFQTHPIHQMTVAREGNSRTVARSPRLSRLSGLTLTAVNGADSPSEFTTCPRLRGLHEFCRFGSMNGSRWIEALSQDRPWPRLRELRLLSCRLGPNDLRRLFAVDHWPELEALDLTGNAFTGFSLAAGAKLPLLRQLKRLVLVDVYYLRRGWGQFAHLDREGQLETLRLGNASSSFSEEDIRVLGACRFFHAVRELDLSHNRLGAYVVPALSGGGLWLTLRSLNLTNSDTCCDWTSVAPAPELRRVNLCRSFHRDPSALASFAKWPGLASVQTLDLSQNRFGGEELAALGRSPYLKNLRILNLEQCSLDDYALRQLVESPLMARLQELRLSGNRLSRVALQAIAQSPASAGLRCLAVGHCRMSRNTARALAESPNLGSLVSLVMSSIPDANTASMLHHRWGNGFRSR